MRTCGYCGHPELNHFAFECGYIERKFGPPYLLCACFGFTAQDLSSREAMDAYIDQAIKERLGNRGQVGDVEVADDYGAFRKHLADVMDREITR